MRTPREVIDNFDGVPRTQTKFAFGSAAPAYTRTPPNGNLAAKVWPLDQSSPTLSQSSDGAGSSARINANDDKYSIQAVIGYNRSSSRQYLRIRGRRDMTWTLVVSFPVEGLQPFSYSQPITLVGFGDIEVDFATEATAEAPTTDGAFFGTLFYSPA